MMNNPKLKAALIGGGVFGVLAALPYIEMINVVCCALFIGGGVLAAEHVGNPGGRASGLVLFSWLGADRIGGGRPSSVLGAEAVRYLARRRPFDVGQRVPSGRVSPV